MTDQDAEALVRLNAMGVLTRREVEARLLGPLLAALSDEFGAERVRSVTRQAIIEIARSQGAQLAHATGGCSLAHFAASLDAWKKDGAMEIELLEQSEQRLSFNVTRCRYAEMYASLGLKDLGELLSCNRDHSLIEGFNPQVHLERNQTIMSGAEFCDFRYSLE